MTTHIILRITADANAHPDSIKHTAYGPIAKDEALAIMDAGHSIFNHLRLCIERNDDRNTITAWRLGSSVTWKLLLIELRPATEDVCEGIL